MNEHSNKTLGWLVTDAARLVRRRLEQEAKGMPMTAAQLRVAGHVARNEGISQAALATLLEVEPITLCRHIDRMEAAGLVERRPDPADRRARSIVTTDKARELLAPMRRRAAAVYDQALDGLTEEQRQAVMHGLEIIVANLSGQVADNAAPARRSANRPARQNP